MATSNTAAPVSADADELLSSQSRLASCLHNIKHALATHSARGSVDALKEASEAMMALSRYISSSGSAVKACATAAEMAKLTKMIARQVGKREASRTSGSGAMSHCSSEASTSSSLLWAGGSSEHMAWSGSEEDPHERGSEQGNARNNVVLLRQQISRLTEERQALLAVVENMRSEQRQPLQSLTNRSNNNNNNNSTSATEIKTPHAGGVACEGCEKLRRSLLEERVRSSAFLDSLKEAEEIMAHQREKLQTAEHELRAMPQEHADSPSLDHASSREAEHLAQTQKLEAIIADLRAEVAAHKNNVIHVREELLQQHDDEVAHLRADLEMARQSSAEAQSHMESSSMESTRRIEELQTALQMEELRHSTDMAALRSEINQERHSAQSALKQVAAMEASHATMAEELEEQRRLRQNEVMTANKTSSGELHERIADLERALAREQEAYTVDMAVLQTELEKERRATIAAMHRVAELEHDNAELHTTLLQQRSTQEESALETSMELEAAQQQKQQQQASLVREGGVDAARVAELEAALAAEKERYTRDVGALMEELDDEQHAMDAARQQVSVLEHDNKQLRSAVEEERVAHAASMEQMRSELQHAKDDAMAATSANNTDAATSARVEELRNALAREKDGYAADIDHLTKEIEKERRAVCLATQRVSLLEEENCSMRIALSEQQRRRSSTQMQDSGSHHPSSSSVRAQDADDHHIAELEEAIAAEKAHYTADVGALVEHLEKEMSESDVALQHVASLAAEGERMRRELAHNNTTQQQQQQQASMEVAAAQAEVEKLRAALALEQTRYDDDLSNLVQALEVEREHKRASAQHEDALRAELTELTHQAEVWRCEVEQLRQATNNVAELQQQLEHKDEALRNLGQELEAISTEREELRAHEERRREDDAMQHVQMDDDAHRRTEVMAELLALQHELRATLDLNHVQDEDATREMPHDAWMKAVKHALSDLRTSVMPHLTNTLRSLDARATSLEEERHRADAARQQSEEAAHAHEQREQDLQAANTDALKCAEEKLVAQRGETHEWRAASQTLAVERDALQTQLSAAREACARVEEELRREQSEKERLVVVLRGAIHESKRQAAPDDVSEASNNALSAEVAHLREELRRSDEAKVSLQQQINAIVSPSSCAAAAAGTRTSAVVEQPDDLLLLYKLWQHEHNLVAQVLREAHTQTSTNIISAKVRRLAVHLEARLCQLATETVQLLHAHTSVVAQLSQRLGIQRVVLKKILAAQQVCGDDGHRGLAEVDDALLASCDEVMESVVPRVAAPNVDVVQRASPAPRTRSAAAVGSFFVGTPQGRGATNVPTSSRHRFEEAKRALLVAERRLANNMDGGRIATH